MKDRNVPLWLRNSLLAFGSYARTILAGVRGISVLHQISMTLTNEDIFHIAKLVRLRIAEEDAGLYREQIGSILEYVAKLQTLDTAGVSELAYGGGVTNVFRDDVVAGCAPDVRERILAAFPRRSGDLLEVQAVFEGRTE